ncbi:MAG: hypothetical protein IKN38_10435 [Clostridia bacterium]|nr:hypothetical protein [Clostridia bacterium]
MTYTPKSQNKKHTVAAVVLFFAAVMMFFFGTKDFVKWRAACQAIGILLLSGAAFFIIKKITAYTYSVYPKDENTQKSVSALSPDELTFIISKQFGSSAKANRAAFDLSCLKKATDLPAKYSKKRAAVKAEGKLELYYYTVTFMAPQSLLLIFERDGAGRVGIVIEPDSDLRAFFKEIANMNKE